MPQFRTKRRVQHSAADMFDLVADVERYPEFVPLCQSLRVRKRTGGEGTETLVADMTARNRDHFLKARGTTGTPPLTGVRTIVLVVFGLSFVIMVWGVAAGGWSSRRSTGSGSSGLRGWRRTSSLRAGPGCGAVSAFWPTGLIRSPAPCSGRASSRSSRWC